MNKHQHLFLVGAQRSGTTYLYQVLNSHPEIEMNQPWWPEPKFFLAKDSDLKVDEYLRKYYTDKKVKVRGDKSASYIESPAAAERISKCFPDAKIIFILRDPVDRAVSNYWYTLHHKLEDRQIDEALSAETNGQRAYDATKVSVSPFRYLQRGKYVDFIDAYAKLFPKEQLKLLIFEDFIGNRVAVKELYRFLGVDPEFLPELDNKVNDYGPPNGEDTISKETETFLTGYFREKNQQLAETYGVDISKWRA